MPTSPLNAILAFVLGMLPTAARASYSNSSTYCSSISDCYYGWTVACCELSEEFQDGPPTDASTCLRMYGAGFDTVGNYHSAVNLASPTDYTDYAEAYPPLTLDADTIGNYIVWAGASPSAESAALVSVTVNIAPRSGATGTDEDVFLMTFAKIEAGRYDRKNFVPVATATVTGTELTGDGGGGFSGLSFEQAGVNAAFQFGRRVVLEPGIEYAYTIEHTQGPGSYHQWQVESYRSNTVDDFEANRMELTYLGGTDIVLVQSDYFFPFKFTVDVSGNEGHACYYSTMPEPCAETCATCDANDTAVCTSCFTADLALITDERTCSNATTTTMTGAATSVTTSSSGTGTSATGTTATGTSTTATGTSTTITGTSTTATATSTTATVSSTTATGTSATSTTATATSTTVTGTSTTATFTSTTVTDVTATSTTATTVSSTTATGTSTTATTATVSSTTVTGTSMTATFSSTTVTATSTTATVSSTAATASSSTATTTAIDAPKTDCIDFEDLVPGAKYSAATGPFFSEGGKFVVGSEAAVGLGAPGGDVEVKSLPTGLALNDAGHHRQAMAVSNVILEHSLTTPSRAGCIHFGEYGGHVYIRLNGMAYDFSAAAPDPVGSSAANFADFDGLTFGGVRVEVTIKTTSGGGHTGVIGFKSVTNLISSVEIGGQELLVDHYCFGCTFKAQHSGTGSRAMSVGPAGPKPLPEEVGSGFSMPPNTNTGNRAAGPQCHECHDLLFPAEQATDSLMAAHKETRQQMAANNKDSAESLERIQSLLETSSDAALAALAQAAIASQHERSEAAGRILDLESAMASVASEMGSVQSMAQWPDASFAEHLGALPGRVDESVGEMNANLVAVAKSLITLINGAVANLTGTLETQFQAAGATPAASKGTSNGSNGGGPAAAIGGMAAVLALVLVGAVAAVVHVKRREHRGVNSGKEASHVHLESGSASIARGIGPRRFSGSLTPAAVPPAHDYARAAPLPHSGATYTYETPTGSAGSVFDENAFVSSPDSRSVRIQSVRRSNPVFRASVDYASADPLPYTETAAVL